MSSSFSSILAQASRVRNARSAGLYTILPITAQNVPDDSYAAQIAAICNEPLIYDLLFAERRAGTPYALTDAERFLSWARRGWQEQTHFVYLICDENGVPAGAIDIKSANQEAAEIGYWLSSAHSGVMANAVGMLYDRARKAGYISLYALVRVVNTRSANVLRRAGFTPTESFVKNDIPYERWELRLA